MTFHRLDLGLLDLVDADGHPETEFWFEALADGFTLGSPQAVTVIQDSLMRDGEDERWDRDSNREVTFTVVARGSDLAALSDAERALRLSTYRPNELAWTPPDGYGATTVFHVVTSSFALTPVSDTWDLQEARPGTKSRAYAVTLRCKPHGRSVDPETVTFTTAAPTLTAVDDCSSTANWQGGSGATLTATTDGGESVLAFSGGYLTYVGPRPTAAFYALDVRRGVTVQPVHFARVVMVERLTTRAYDRHWLVNDPDAPMQWFLSGSNQRIANLVAADKLPGVLSAPISGSVRSEGSVLLSRATGTTSRELRWAMVYADPQLADGFLPSVRDTWQYGREGTYTVYVSATAENGSAVGGAAGDVLTWTLNGQALRTRLDADGASLPWRPLGEVHLGGRRDGTIGPISASTTVAVNGTAQALPVRIFRKHPDASLTYVAPGQGSGVYEIEIASPSLDLPRGGVFAAGSALTSYALAPSPSIPVVTPPEMYLWVDGYNNGASFPITVQYAHVPRWHTYAGK